jgi:hypothetical protein
MKVSDALPRCSVFAVNRHLIGTLPGTALQNMQHTGAVGQRCVSTPPEHNTDIRLGHPGVVRVACTEDSTYARSCFVGE